MKWGGNVRYAEDGKKCILYKYNAIWFLKVKRRQYDRLRLVGRYPGCEGLYGNMKGELGRESED